MLLQLDGLAPNQREWEVFRCNHPNDFDSRWKTFVFVFVVVIVSFFFLFPSNRYVSEKAVPLHSKWKRKWTWLFLSRCFRSRWTMGFVSWSYTQAILFFHEKLFDQWMLTIKYFFNKIFIVFFFCYMTSRWSFEKAMRRTSARCGGSFSGFQLRMFTHKPWRWIWSSFWFLCLTSEMRNITRCRDR